MSPTALITGITGQDGHYLARELVAIGMRVVGTTRGLGDPRSLLGEMAGRVGVVQWDLKDPVRFIELLQAWRPTQVYNLAAFTSGEQMDCEPELVTDINGVAVLRMLETIRHIDPSIRFFQASSSEVFAASGVSPQNEATPCMPRSIYGAAKVYGDTVVRLYREKYGLYACSGILFNHESPLRGDDFVTQKVARAAVRIKLGRQAVLLLGNLSASRDWGFAGDFARAMRMMLAADAPRDYVIATGQIHTVRQLCELAFGILGLDYRVYVQMDPRHYRADEPSPIVGDARSALQHLGWSPRVSFQEMVAMMVECAMAMESATP